MKNNFRISIIDEKYYYNPDKGVVTCVINYRLKFANEKIARFHEGLCNICEAWEYFSKIWGTFTVAGVAKCLNGDTYDRAIGEKIAYAKAESAAYNDVAAHFTRLQRTYRELFSTNVADFMSTAGVVIDKNDEYISKF